MVHSYLTRIFSLGQSESQMVTIRQVMPLPPNPNALSSSPDHLIPSSSCRNNNNIDSKEVEACGSASEGTRWSQNTSWTWDPNLSEKNEYTYSDPRFRWSSKKTLWLIAGIISVILVITVIVGIFLVLSPPSQPTDHERLEISTTTTVPTQAPSIVPSEFKTSLRNSDNSENVKRVQQEILRRKASKLSWEMLNRSDKKQFGSNGRQSPVETISSDDNDGDEVILPAQMVYTSGGVGVGQKSPTAVGGATGGKTRSCCRTQKYTQVIRREGCEPVTIVNRMCFGQCVSVWVPGLFASFPVCRPSRSTWKTVTLTCGKKRERRKRVKVERVRRCSCMEMEPTPSTL